MELGNIIVNVSLTTFLIIGLMIFIVSNRQADGKINLYFIAYTAVVCLLLVFDAWEYYLGRLPRLNGWRYFTTAMCYTLRPVAITVMNVLLHQKNATRVLLWLPNLVLAGFAFTNRYTGLICSFDENNYWRGGPLRFLPHIVSGVCLLILIAETILKHEPAKPKGDALFVFILAINIFATLVETIFNVRFLLTGTMMVSCVLYYSIVNKQNEKQQTARYEQEIANGKIAIMLSQIQPHFLYNTLSSIRLLCKSDPAAAQATVDDFAKYLRGNLDSIKRNTPVPFSKELEHIRVYLSLEKKRFEDELQVVWNIEAEGFMIPALTVQPLVENAVKHGVGKKLGGGTVTISTRERENFFEITVADDGVGYDPLVQPTDGRSHIGIENVRARLEAMCCGSLYIASTPGVGTTATICIPKEERNVHANSMR